MESINLKTLRISILLLLLLQLATSCNPPMNNRNVNVIPSNCNSEVGRIDNDRWKGTMPYFLKDDYQDFLSSDNDFDCIVICSFLDESRAFGVRVIQNGDSLSTSYLSLAENSYIPYSLDINFDSLKLSNQTLKYYCKEEEKDSIIMCAMKKDNKGFVYESIPRAFFTDNTFSYNVSLFSSIYKEGLRHR